MTIGLEELWLAFWIGVLVTVVVAATRSADRVVSDAQREEEEKRAEYTALRMDTRREEEPYLSASSDRASDEP